MKKIVFASALALTLAGAVLTNDVFANDRLVATQSADGRNENVLSSEVLNPSSGNVLVGIKGEFLTPDKQAILDAINKIRKEAADEGLVDQYVPIKWSTDLEKTAFVRATEVSVTLKPERLSTKEIWTAFPSSNSIKGEALDVNYEGFLKAIENWHAEKANYVAKKKGGTSKEFTGYYELLINSKFTYVGLAAFRNSASSQKVATISLALGDDASSEELAGGYGPAIQYTEVTASNLSTVKSKATVVEKPLKDFRTSSQSGWVKSNGNWYFYESGDVRTGWVKTGGKWYYLNGLGVMQTGFVEVDGAWYFLDNSGAMFTGWGTDGSRWFYFDGSGVMKTGWYKENGAWYYLDQSGVMKTGWYKENGTWYYLDQSGVMKTGWFKVGQYWYYAYGSGALAVNTTTPDGYRVNGNGEWVN
ncbi:CAP domain-containing protein [Streptococcus sp. 116-D4]|uniref:CAP domain-containing protein n=1 Tax=Streptococcus sp. 116-D4 TaxID=2598453 RepID=UPI0012B488E0|nr:CAP domain-containing protein [Streptococcus sp. 116-D4]BBP08876.1 choline-binding protein C [Streptococcus sp. 116-D4]